MRNGYIIDTLLCIDIQEIVITGEKTIEINEGIIHRANFKVSPFREVTDRNIALRQI